VTPSEEAPPSPSPEAELWLEWGVPSSESSITIVSISAAEALLPDAMLLPADST
jgi:hypothetical protein